MRQDSTPNQKKDPEKHRAWKFSLKHLICIVLVSPTLLFLLHYFGAIKISPDIAFGNMLQPLATIFSAYLVTTHLQRNVSNYQKQKDLLTRELDRLEMLLNQFDDIASPRKWSDVNNFSQKVTIKIANIVACAEECGCDKQLTLQCDLRSHIENIRSSMTNTDIVQDEDYKATLSMEYIIWGDGREKLVRMHIDSLKSDIFKSQLKISMT